LDDQKEASKIAVETVKLFITIGTAALVADGTFVQFARNGGVPWVSVVMLLFGLTALGVVVSMIVRFTAISRIYKRADGRIDGTKPAWSTEAVKKRLDLQGIFGIASLLLLVGALVAWADQVGNPPASVAVTISGSGSGIIPSGPLKIEGTWTSLKLQTAAGQELTLPAQSQPITLTCR
jgi:uncharacterized membrane protein